ncbi:hypothetical protein PENSPDRAFT_669302 [Peniophora sp. CONT]|nr:hypothetical protein PENSPDRAFT_669302 [Peniophora sp. CONT]
MSRTCYSVATEQERSILNKPTSFGRILDDALARSIRNYRQLPVELLSMIFRIAAMSDPPVLPLGHIESSPGWLVLGWPYASTVFQEHAKGLPVDYILNARSPSVPLTSFMGSNSDNRMIYHLMRNTPLENCRVVEVKDGRSDVMSHIYDLSGFKTPLLRLERLVLHTWSWEWTGPRAKLLAQGLESFAIHAPKCTHIHLQNAFTVIYSHSVTSFTLRFDSEWTPRPHFRAFHRMLRSFDANILQHLNLSNAAAESSIPNLPSPFGEPIAMPSLCTLRIEGTTPLALALLHVIRWSCRDIHLCLRIRTDDGPQASHDDQCRILRLCYPTRDEVKGLHLTHAHPNPISQRISIRSWNEPPSEDKKPEKDISFSGALEPCSWHTTALAAIAACGPNAITAFGLKLADADWDAHNIPWEPILGPMSSLGILHPYDKIIASIDSLPKERAPSSAFRAWLPEKMLCDDDQCCAEAQIQKARYPERANQTTNLGSTEDGVHGSLDAARLDPYAVSNAGARNAGIAYAPRVVPATTDIYGMPLKCVYPHESQQGKRTDLTSMPTAKSGEPFATSRKGARKKNKRVPDDGRAQGCS